MRRFKFKLCMLSIWVLYMHCMSCSIDQHFEFPQGPQGPQGPAGLSAYDLWVEYIKEDPTYEGGYGLPDFFLYLKGKDGKDGINGIDGIDGKDGIPGVAGVDGKSAYDFWKEWIANNNIDDPHNPDQKWNKEETEIDDFWWFLTGNNGTNGTNGLSAYELWKIDVGNGIPNPHNPGSDWPKDQTEKEDFWEYLRGRNGTDGKDGEDGIPGNIGTPGEVIETIIGHYNVIAQFSMQQQSEYVNWTDGSVLYHVYDKLGMPLPYATVMGMPGISGDPFMSDSEGKFYVPKDRLPTTGTAIERFGTAIVNGEKGAHTTYVPQKVQVRIRLNNNITLRANNNLGVLQIPYSIERKTENTKNWEIPPSYINFQRYVYHTYVEGKDDPKLTDEFISKSYVSVSATTHYFNATRPVKGSPYIEDIWEQGALPNNGLGNIIWTEEDEYATLWLDTYYGESPRLLDQEGEKNAIYKRVPIQYVPLVGDIIMGNPSKYDGTMTDPTSGNLRDKNLIDYSLFFESALKSNPVSDYTVFEAVPLGEDAAKALDVIGVRFTKQLENSTHEAKTLTPVSLGNDHWEIDGVVYDGSNIQTYTTNVNHFLGLPEYGTLSFADKLVRGLNSAGKFTMPDSNVTFEP